jgi:hypothetical protein
MARQAASFEIRACPFAAMVEEAEIVVFPLERLDFALDKLVQFGQVRGNFGGNFKIHSGAPVATSPGPRPAHRSHQHTPGACAQTTQTGRRPTNARANRQRPRNLLAPG